jgi:hypothetical protein
MNDWGIPVVTRTRGRKEPSAPEEGIANACPVVAEGVLGFTNPDDQRMYGYDAATGKPLWTTSGGVGGGTRNGASPLLWPTDGRELIVSNKSGIDPKDGKVLWRLPGQAGGVCTAVAGEYVLTGGEESDCAAYRATGKGVTKAWALGAAFPINSFSMPVVYRDHAYSMTWTAKEEAEKAKRKFPEFAVTAVELQTGKVVGEAQTGKFNMCQANCAEGRFIWRQYMANADPAGIKQLSMLDYRGCDMAQDTSAAYVCGWLFRRGISGLLCYDLRKDAKE